jgi:hypothetical protein
MDTSNLEVPRDFIQLDAWQHYRAKCRRWGLEETQNGDLTIPTSTKPIIQLNDELNYDEALPPGCNIVWDGLKGLHAHFRDAGFPPFVGLIEFLGMVGLAHHSDSIPEMLLFMKNLSIKEREAQLLNEPEMGPPVFEGQDIFNSVSIGRIYHHVAPTFEQLESMIPTQQPSAISTSMSSLDTGASKDALAAFPDDLLNEIIRRMAPVSTATRLRCLNSSAMKRLSNLALEQQLENDRVLQKHKHIISNPTQHILSCIEALECRFLRAENLSPEFSLKLLLLEAKRVEMHLLFDAMLQKILLTPPPPSTKREVGMYPVFVPESFKDKVTVSLIDTCHENRGDGAAYWMSTSSLFALRLHEGSTTIFVKFQFLIRGWRGNEKSLTLVEYALNDPSHLMLGLSEAHAEARSFLFDPSNLVMSSEVDFLQAKCSMIHHIHFCGPASADLYAVYGGSDDERDEDEEAEAARFRARRTLVPSDDEIRLSNITLYPAAALRSPLTDANRPRVLIDSDGVRLAEEQSLLNILKDYGISGFPNSTQSTGGGIRLPGSITVTPKGISAFIIYLGLCDDTSYRVYMSGNI